MSTPASDTVNPYAAPHIDVGYEREQQTELDGLWRQDNLLVMRKDALLPPICVKSGQPAMEWLQRDLEWHQPWITWTAIVPPVYVILALFMTSRTTVTFGLSTEWANRRRFRMLITAGIVIAGVAAAACEIGIAQSTGYLIAFIVAISLGAGLIGGNIYGHYACRLVRPQQISGQFVWLQGVHSDFLKRLPEWPTGTS